MRAAGHSDASSGPDSRAAVRTEGSSGASSGLDRRTAGRSCGRQPQTAGRLVPRESQRAAQFGFGQQPQIGLGPLRCCHPDLRPSAGLRAPARGAP